MKKQHTAFAALTVLALSALTPSGLLWAQTSASDLRSCLAVQASSKVSASCQALRTEVRAEVSKCMVERRVNAERSHANTNTRSSHAYKARHLVCSQEVLDRFVLAAQ